LSAILFHDDAQSQPASENNIYDDTFSFAFAFAPLVFLSALFLTCISAELALAFSLLFFVRRFIYATTSFLLLSLVVFRLPHRFPPIAFRLSFRSFTSSIAIYSVVLLRLLLSHSISIAPISRVAASSFDL
jgi:hypothetical protein